MPFPSHQTVYIEEPGDKNAISALLHPLTRHKQNVLFCSFSHVTSRKRLARTDCEDRIFLPRSSQNSSFKCRKTRNEYSPLLFFLSKPGEQPHWHSPLTCIYLLIHLICFPICRQRGNCEFKWKSFIYRKHSSSVVCVHLSLMLPL